MVIGLWFSSHNDRFLVFVQAAVSSWHGRYDLGLVVVGVHCVEAWITFLSNVHKLPCTAGFLKVHLHVSEVSVDDLGSH